METVDTLTHVEKQYQELKNFWWNYFKIEIPQIPEEIKLNLNEEIYFVPNKILIIELINQYNLLFPNILNVDKTVFTHPRYDENYFFTCHKKIESSRLIKYPKTGWNLNPIEALIISFFRRIKKVPPIALKTTVLLDTQIQNKKLVINSYFSGRGRKITLDTIKINRVENFEISKSANLIPIKIYKIPMLA